MPSHGFNSRSRARWLVLLALWLLAYPLPVLSLNLLSPGAPSSPEEFRRQWKALGDNRRYEEAQALCEKYREVPALKIEALICLSNLEFAQAESATLSVDTSVIGLGPGESGQGEVPPEYLREFLTEVTVYDQKRIDRALEYLDEALAIDPSRLDIWMGKAHILQASGRHEELLKWLAKMAESTPIKPEEIKAYATIYFDDGKLPQAIDVYQTLSQVYPDNFIIWCDYGALVGRSGDLERALEISKKAETLGEDDILITNLANLKIYLGRFSEALPYLEKMYKKYPRGPEDQLRYLLCLAVVDQAKARELAESMGRIQDKTAEELRKMIAASLEPDAALSYGIAYYKKHQFENALLLLALAGEEPARRYYQAMVYYQIHYLKGEIENLEGYLAQDQQNPKTTVSAHMNLGLAYFQQNQFAEAESHLQIAVDSGMRDSQLLYWLGEAQREQGKIEEAKKSYREAIKINDQPRFVGLAKYRLSQL